MGHHSHTHPEQYGPQTPDEQALDAQHQDEDFVADWHADDDARRDAHAARATHHRGERRGHMQQESQTPLCSRCGTAIQSLEGMVTRGTISELFDLHWCSDACAEADLDDACWHARLRKEEAIFEHIARESGPLEFY